MKVTPLKCKSSGFKCIPRVVQPSHLIPRYFYHPERKSHPPVVLDIHKPGSHPVWPSVSGISHFLEFWGLVSSFLLLMLFHGRADLHLLTEGRTAGLFAVFGD